MPDITGGTIRFVLRGEDQNLSKMISDAARSSEALSKSFKNVVIDVQNASNAMRNHESVLLRTAQAQARLAAAQNRPAEAAKILQGALSQVTTQSVQSINAQTQLARVQQQAASGSATLAQSLKNVGKELGLFGTLFVGQQVLGFANDLVKSANELEKQKAMVGALSKTQEEYNSTLELAKTQQEKFGGSLTENLRSLGAFLNLSQRTGVELKGLENLARRLAIVDPIQGFEGAAVALKEFFSGDITSLSRRFEIPRSVLNDLKNIEDPIQRFQALDKVVSDLGFSQKVLEAQTQTTANTYDRAAAAFENAKNAVGGYLAEILKIPAQVVTEVILKRVANDLPQALPENIQKQKVETQTNFLQNAKDVEAFNAQVERANAIINNSSVAVGLLGGYFDKLTPQMFAAAQAAIQNGQSVEKVSQTISTLGPSLANLSEQFNVMGRAGAITKDEVLAIQDAIAGLSFMSDAGSAAVQKLIAAFLGHKITAEQLLVALQNVAASEAVIAAQTNVNTTAQALAAQREGERTAGLQQLTAAQQEQSAAITDALDKEQAQYAQEQLLKQVKEEIARLAPQVAGGILTTGEAAAIAAGKFHLEADAIERVIDAEARLVRLKGLRAQQDSQTRDLTNPRNPDGTPFGTNNNLSSPGRTGTSNVDAVVAQQKANEELAQSERDLAEARGGNETKLANLRSDLEGLTAGTKEYNNKLTEIINLENQMAKSGGGGARLTAQEKLNNSLLNAQDKTNDKLENAEREHQQRMVDIIEEFEKKQLEAQKKNEVDKRSSRASFYQSLIEEEKVNQQQYSAEYEKAFTESQKLAMSGQQQLANDYLKLRQQQIQDDIEFAKKRAAIAEDKDLSKKEKEARLKALDEVDKLRKEQQAEEVKQLLEGGDANVNALNEKLAAETEKYNEQTGKIKTIADQQADARIAAWERANKTIAGQPPAEITNFANAGVPIPATPVTPQEQSATAPTGTPSDPTSTDATITDAQIMQVAVTGLALVRDEGVIAEISALAARLEAKLGELQTTTTDQGGRIVDKLGSVQDAIKNIKVKLVNA